MVRDNAWPAGSSSCGRHGTHGASNAPRKRSRQATCRRRTWRSWRVRRTSATRSPRRQDALLDIAPTMPPDEFQVVMRQWRNSADERLLDSGGFDAAARCYLRGTPVLGNLVKIDGMFETDGWAAAGCARSAGQARREWRRACTAECWAPASRRARRARREPEVRKVLVGACGQPATS